MITLEELYSIYSVKKIVDLSYQFINIFQCKGRNCMFNSAVVQILGGERFNILCDTPDVNKGTFSKSLLSQVSPMRY